MPDWGYHPITTGPRRKVTAEEAGAINVTQTRRGTKWRRGEECEKSRNLNVSPEGPEMSNCFHWPLHHILGPSNDRQTSSVLLAYSSRVIKVVVQEHLKDHACRVCFCAHSCKHFLQEGSHSITLESHQSCECNQILRPGLQENVLPWQDHSRLSSGTNP